MENSSKLCLVTGANGVIGVPLVTELLNRGHRVRVIVRQLVDSFPSQVEQVVGDICDDEILENAAKDCVWVFHLAAKLHINKPSRSLENEYRETNFVATVKLLENSKKAEKFIFFSTINVYGCTDGYRTLTENDEIDPQGFYAESKALAEKHVIQSKNGVVLRLAAVYGSRMKGNYLSVLAMIKKGIFVFVGAGNNRRTIVHHNDAARAAIFLAEIDSSVGEIYNVSDNQIHRFHEIVSAMYSALGKRLTTFSVSVRITRKLLFVSDRFASLFGLKLPVSNDLLEKLIEDMAVSSNKLYNLGFEAEFDLNKGWREVVEN